MKCVVTGAGGFLGWHLTQHLQAEGRTVVAAGRLAGRSLPAKDSPLTQVEVDIADRSSVLALVREHRPDVIYHMAAQSLPGVSWQDPELTIRVNVLGTVHLLDAVRSSGTDPVIVVMGSSSEYAPDPVSNQCIDETHPLQPSSPYAVSKVAAGQLCRLYHKMYGLRIIQVRPFLISGPRKTGDAVSDFARQIVAVEQSRQAFVEVGNLDAIRDYLDVRDAMKAFVLLATKGEPGGVYNVCSGTGRRMGDLLDMMIRMSGVPVEVRRRRDALRRMDEPVRIGNPSQLRALGWEWSIPLERTLEDVLGYWRDNASD